MTKTGYLLEKMGDIKENISCKDRHNKGQKEYGPNRSRKIKKRWQEDTELYKKALNDPDNHNDVVTHLEPDIFRV